MTLHRDEIEPMEMNSYYYSMREAICQAELLILRVVSFQVDVEHPHKYLLAYLKSLKNWYDAQGNDLTMFFDAKVKIKVVLIFTGKSEFTIICNASWAILQDLYQDSRIVDLDNRITSLACIELALRTYGMQIPNTNKNSWHKVSSLIN